MRLMRGMGKMLISHQRYRYKGGMSPKLLKKIVAQRDNIKNPDGYDLDHIIPYCISTDNSIENLQLLTEKEHVIKTTQDFKILKILRKYGYYEKLTNFSLRLIFQQWEVVEKFRNLKKEQENQVKQVRCVHGYT